MQRHNHSEPPGGLKSSSYFKSMLKCLFNLESRWISKKPKTPSAFPSCTQIQLTYAAMAL